MVFLTSWSTKHEKKEGYKKRRKEGAKVMVMQSRRQNLKGNGQLYQLNSACFRLICSKCCSNATTEFVLFFDEIFFARFPRVG